MNLLETIAFFALCLGVPVAMASILVWRLVQWIASRRGWSRRMAEGAWRPLEESKVRAQLVPAGLRDERTTLSHLAEKDGVWVADYHWVSRGTAKNRMGRRRRLVIVERVTEGDPGVLQRRGGSLLEKAAVGLGGMFGQDPIELEGWEWALVYGPAGWLPAERAAAVDALIGPGERLHLSRTHAVLSMPEGRMDALLDDAATRAEKLREAVG